MSSNWPEWVIPSEQEVEELSAAAARQWSARPAPWMGGVISALAWVGGYDEGPYSSGGSGAEEYDISIELDVAHRQADEGPWPDHRDYGAAVVRTLEWLRGAERPVPLRCDYYDDSVVAEQWRVAAVAAAAGPDMGWVSEDRQLAQLVHDTRSRAEEAWDEVDG